MQLTGWGGPALTVTPRLRPLDLYPLSPLALPPYLAQYPGTLSCVPYPGFGAAVQTPLEKLLFGCAWIFSYHFKR